MRLTLESEIKNHAIILRLGGNENMRNAAPGLAWRSEM